MLNSVIMTGRMVADPELRTTQSDIKVTSFRMAVTRNYKVNDEYPSDFFTVVAWRNTAEFVAKHFKKGDGLTVQGRAEVRKYTDKDGNKRSAVDIIAENVYFGDSKKDGETSENASAPTTGYATAPSQNSDFANVGEEDGELPF